MESLENNHQTEYLKNVPFIFILILGWFFYAGFSNVLKVPSIVYALVLWWTPKLQVLTTLLPVALAFLNFGIVWGLYQQKRWVKKLLVVWFVFSLSAPAYVFYSVLNSIGYNSLNEFFIRGIFNSYVWISLLVSLVYVGIDAAIIYYLFKKVDFK